MAGDKYVKMSSGQLAEQAAVQSSAGAGDAGKIVALDSGGKLAESMMPAGIGADVVQATAHEALGAGDLVNLFNSSGTLKARKADASNGYRAHGFVKTSVESAAPATVYKSGTISGLTGLTLGAQYFLSGAAAGGVVATAPSTAGHIVQDVGVALSATELAFEPQNPITVG